MQLANTTEHRGTRRQQILEALARELEVNPGSRITTANLAKSVGVSEAALYRHFASKARMFDGLIEFAEDTIFGLVNQILSDDYDAIKRCQKICSLLLKFSERNPGITRILMGDALVGETSRLRSRVAKLFDRLETQFKQVLREGQLHSEIAPDSQVQVVAELLVSVVVGRLNQYVRSDFMHKPTQRWDEQWYMLSAGINAVQQPL
ncbi:MAG: nucleoid occlusion factor SlmA [Gammaproteobacteria bacterium]|nr:nucleoid occlusion factor SlmA [Gammaproteobacteria bacterium]